MGDYYRRDRVDDGKDRRYATREDNYQRPVADYHSEGAGGEERYPRSRSREGYQDRDREDYSYRRDRDRDRQRDPRSQDRDRHYDSPSPPQPYVDHDIEAPPQGPRSDRGKPPQQQQQQHHYPEDSYDAGKPNAQVIFRGLDKETTETDVYKHFHTLRTFTNIHSCNNFFTFNKTLPLKV